MRTFVLITAILLGAGFAKAQSLKKYPIAETGASVYMFCEPKFKLSFSPDSSGVYTADCEKDDVTYSIIYIRLLSPPETLNQAEALLIAYMDFLKTEFDIVSAAGYGKGHRLNNDDNTRGIVDYWKHKDGEDWKVKGWTDGKRIAVLYGYSKKELPEPKLNVFLDGFRFGN
jgi:hypothetical protein